MDEDELQQFCLRWHHHQDSIVTALSQMLWSGQLADVTLCAGGVTLKAHRLLLASCSQYFAELFKEVEYENGSLVIILDCEAAELRLLLTFMYTGEVTAPKHSLPALLRLAQTLKVSGLTDCNSNYASSTSVEDDKEKDVNPISLERTNNGTLFSEQTSPVDMQTKIHEETSKEMATSSVDDEIKSYRLSPSEENKYNFNLPNLNYNEMPKYDDIIPKIPDTALSEPTPSFTSMIQNTERERLSKLDQIVQNLYNSRSVMPILPSAARVPISESSPYPTDRKWRDGGAFCSICHKRLSNQYNLRVHMETHAGTRHACHACSHVSRSRDALRKHVAYRHPSSVRNRNT